MGNSQGLPARRMIFSPEAAVRPFLLLPLVGVASGLLFMATVSFFARRLSFRDVPCFTEAWN